MATSTRPPIFTSRERSYNRAAWSLEAATEALSRTLRLAGQDGAEVDALERALLHAHRARRLLDRGTE